MNLTMATATLAALATTTTTTTAAAAAAAASASAVVPAFLSRPVASTARRRASSCYSLSSSSSSSLAGRRRVVFPPSRAAIAARWGGDGRDDRFGLFSSSSSYSSSSADANVDADASTSTSNGDATEEGKEGLSSLRSAFLIAMRDRGFLHQCTDLVALDDLLADAEMSSSSSSSPSPSPSSSSGGDGSRAISAYLGFDATADSLHVGSLLQIMILRHLQKSGHRPIVLVGGGTSKVGDPTGKDESRALLTDDVIRRNTQGISRVFRKFLDFGPDDGDEDGGDRSRRPNDAIMVNNDEWLSSLKYLQFLRDYGTHFTINRMLGFESVRQRLSREAPFTFLEFNYMILQAYDFLELNRRHGAVLQLGGSDQWGNMISGVELGRRVDSVRLYALTAPLITTSDGKKMGKTAGGAVWLNPDRLSEYDYWQFWRNTDDGDVIRFLKLFTELPLEEIRAMEGWTGADVNRAKVVLADEATALLHGRECLRSIRDTVDGMFGGGAASTEGLNRVYVNEDDVGGDGVRIADLFVRLGLASSKKEAKRLISGGGAKLGETKIADENAALGMDAFADGSREVTLRAGKKRAGVVELK